MTLLGRADEAAVASYLAENLVGPLSLELWTRKQSLLVRSDRDPCTHCDDTLELARQIASLHPGVSLTLYDLDRHADRATEAGVERPPLTVIRAHGHTLRFVGLWSGLLLPAFIETMVFAAAGNTPLQEATREVLAGLAADVEVEVLVAPYDPYSGYMMRVVLALGVASPRVRAQVTEMAEFPLLAAARGVTEVPVLLLNGRRYVGAWDEGDLVEQLRRVAAGDDSPVIRERVPVTPFLTEDEARKAAAAQAGAQPPAPGGLVLPGSP